MDDPNRQAVGLEPAWVEGTGGEAGDAAASPEAEAEAEAEAGADGEAPSAEELDAMTKDELLALAQSLGISPANAAMTKAELRAAVDAHYATG